MDTPEEKPNKSTVRLTEILAVRVRKDFLEEITRIAEYEQANSPTDLARTWIMSRASDYRNNTRYIAWRREQEAKASAAAKEKLQARIQ